MVNRKLDCASAKIAVIGGGIGGLAAALALLRRGIDVDVYEQSTELKGVGAGIHISCNGTRVLDALGLQAALARVQVIPSRRQIRHWKTGETWNWFELGEPSVGGTRHMLLHRGDLHGILADAVRSLKADAIKLGKRCVAVTQSDEQVEAWFATGEVANAAFVIGADGIHSKVRECLFGADQPEFTGCVAWRGLVPMEHLPPHISGFVGTTWLGPKGNVLHYPVRRGELMNFVSTVERDDWRIESWTVEGTTEELANDFRGWHADVHAIIEEVEAPRKWALMVRRPMDCWTKGRITLLGDACHPTLPYLGQGAVMAIEDAYVVAACLEKYFSHPATAFARYEAIRRDWTAAVVRKSHENRKQIFSPVLADEHGVAVSVVRDWQQVRVAERLDWLYAYDATSLQI
jgi:2-polyprenyl-6-methoxyphenol hydroxylase-like FAD-dependent oxidoreductase